MKKLHAKLRAIIKIVKQMIKNPIDMNKASKNK